MQKMQSDKPVELFEAEPFDFVINICELSSTSCNGRKDECPTLSGTRSIGCWGGDHMAETGVSEKQMLAHLRRVRDQIAGRLRVWMPAVDKQ